MSKQEKMKEVRDKLARHKDCRIGIAKRKALLLLLGGLTLGLSGSPRTSWKIVQGMNKEWKELGRQAAERVVNSLYASELVEAKENADGTATLTLSEKGRKKALTYDIVRMKIPVPSRWDRLWRIVSFDVPEDEKSARDSLREHLFRLGFYELQKSVFIYPYECLSEIQFIAGLYNVGKYIRYILAVHIDNEKMLKDFFGMNQEV
ncbi:MAG: Transcriptional regulator, PaaX family protein [Parcubacteria group bacterium GW2011_GWA2_49_9]|nr:MAG: Transcriptional regulator, PaaX family protein [Parcubacteria group bacterium GW2011_GWA2_49_9]